MNKINTKICKKEEGRKAFISNPFQQKERKQQKIKELKYQQKKKKNCLRCSPNEKIMFIYFRMLYTMPRIKNVQKLIIIRLPSCELINYVFHCKGLFTSKWTVRNRLVLLLFVYLLLFQNFVFLKNIF